jgi:branched-chain amino acid transport system substrate-binding protein
MMAACDRPDDRSSVTTSTTVVRDEPSVRRADGKLRIAVFVPRSGLGASIGEGIDAGAQLAATEINAAGGFNRQPVELVRAEEPESLSETTQALATVLADDVDAIVGLASSRHTLALAERLRDAGILACSPTASSLALEGLDDDNLLFRTVPSDSLQAEALAAAVERSGASTVALVYIDDEYGRPLAELGAGALLRNGVAVNLSIPTDGSADGVERAAQLAADSNERTVVVIADAAVGPALIAKIDERSLLSPSFVVNDAMRRPSADVEPYGVDLAARVSGVAPVATPSQAFLERLRTVNPNSNGAYAANAYDCVNLVALAAVASNTDQSRRMAEVFGGLTNSGFPCATFADCVAALDTGRNFQYDGSNQLELGQDGDPTRAVFELFGYDDTGRDVARGRLDVTEP